MIFRINWIKFKRQNKNQLNDDIVSLNIPIYVYLYL